jgi:hypothetical protein
MGVIINPLENHWVFDGREIAYLIGSHDCPQKGRSQELTTLLKHKRRQSSCLNEFAFSSRHRASGASLTCIYSPLSYLTRQVTGQRDAEEIPRGPRGASCTPWSLNLSALMIPMIQAAEKSIALLKSSPDVATNLSSGVFRLS